MHQAAAVPVIPNHEQSAKTRQNSPVKQEASNCWMSGFRLCATASRSSILWYNKPSAPKTCISIYDTETLLEDEILSLHPLKDAGFPIQQLPRKQTKQEYIAVV
jgi:hypothetical protein